MTEALLAELRGRVEALKDRAAIERLQYQYGLYMDDRMVHELADLFTDAELDFRLAERRRVCREDELGHHRPLALEHAAFNIRVNAIAPGPFVTGITRPGAAAWYEANLPMRCAPTGQDLHGLAIFLASNASRLITGAEIPLDAAARLGSKRA